MRPICWATLDTRRPVLVLTRELAVGRMSTVTVAPITRRVHGIATEVTVGRRNGLEERSVVKCDQIATIPVEQLHEQCGWLLEDQEPSLHEAVQAAFDLV
jgi:mRNA interferase MazF